MKRKIGTVLDEELFLRAKQVALMQRRSLSQLFEEALRSYLSNFQRKRGIVEATRGSMKLPPEDLQGIMEEADVFET